MLKLHLWAPNMFEFKGGIQVFSRLLREAILEDGSSVSTFLKLERASSVPADARNIHCFGTIPPLFRTAYFALAAMSAAIRQRPALILSTHLNFGPAALCARKLAGIPYWLVAHGVDAWGIAPGRRLLALEAADKIIAVSRYTKQRILESYAIEESRIALLPNSFEENRFTIGARPANLMDKFQIAPQDPVILSVCRLDAREKYKGYDLIIDSLPRLLRNFPRLRYLIVGTGNDSARIQKKIDDAKLNSHVTLVGRVSDAELPEYYRLCTLFALPSTGEGFGIVFLEALASGKPVIAGNLDGSVDPLCDGALGSLIDPRSHDEFIASTERILVKQCNNELVQEGQRLRSEVVRRFGQEAFAKQVTDLLAMAAL